MDLGVALRLTAAVYGVGKMREARPILFTLQPGNPGGACPGCGWVQKLEFRVPRLEPYVPEE